MDAVRKELGRLGRAYARAVGGRRAAQAHLTLLVLAVVAAVVHRMVLPLPVMARLADHWLPTLLCALVLLFLGPLLSRLVPRIMQPRAETLARRLDDRFSWRDETSTVIGLSEQTLARPVPALLAMQAAGRLRAVGAETLGRVQRPRRWPRYLLVFLFVFVLMAPGVQGLFGRVGPTAREDAGRGSADVLEPAGPPRPMRADFWLQCFVQNPLPVEPLPTVGPIEPGSGPR